MRLSCPSCRILYDVPGGVIPETGRIVECPSCGRVWLQKPVATADVEAASPAPADTADGVSDETGATPIDEPDEGGEVRDLPPRLEHSPEVLRILREEAERETRLRQQDVTQEPALPDRGVPAEARVPPAESAAAPTTETARADRTGFTRGFLTALAIAALAVLAYVNAPRIAERVPQAEPALTIYVEKVNAVRLWLAVQAQAMGLQ